MNKKRNANIKSVLRAVSVSTAMIVFFVGIVLFYYNMLYAEKRNSIIREGENSAIQTANEFNEYLTTSLDAIKITAYTLNGMLEESKSNTEILDYLVSQSDAVMNAVFENTTGIYGYINDEFLDGAGWVPDDDYDATKRPWYIKAMENKNEINIIEPYLDAQTGNMMMALAATLTDGKSVVAFDISLDRIQEITETVTEEDSDKIELILDQNDIVIAHSDKAELQKNYNEEKGTLGAVIAEKLHSSSNDYFEFDYNGAHYIAYSSSIVNDWRCISVRNVTSAFGSLTTMLIITIVIIALIILSLVLLLSNNIGRRLANERISNQLSSTADIYVSMHEIDFVSDTFSEVRNNKQEASKLIGETRNNCQQMIRAIMTQFSDESTRADILDFVDFTKLDARLKDTNTATCEFLSADGKWRKARYIVSKRLADGRVSNAMYLIEDIDKESRAREAALNVAKTLNYRISSISNIYMTAHEMELATDTFTEIKSDKKYVDDLVGEAHKDAQKTLFAVMANMCAPSFVEDVHRFIDMSTVERRLGKSNTITIEYMNKEGLWRRGRIIVSRRDENGKLTHVMWLTEDINEEKAERDKLSEAADMLNNRISTISNIFNTVYEVDLENDTFSEIKNGTIYATEFSDSANPDAQATLMRYGKITCDPSSYEEAEKFFDFSTLPNRLKNTDTVSAEFENKDRKWRRARFIVSKRNKKGTVTHVLYLTEDITAEKAERDKLLDMSERAIAASEAKSSFLSNMSHEIRTPINAVLGMNEMILRECGDKTILEYSESIRTAGTTLLCLVNDILDFSKIEAGKMEIIPVDYDLSSVINDLVNMIQTKVDNKGLKLKLEISRDVPKLLHGDEVRIKQIVTNILTNAVKYTEQGFVSFCIDYRKPDDDPDSVMLEIAVKDTGIGIKKEDMKKLFSEFDRIEEKRNRNVEGTGLGMSITKRLLEMMDSHLQVESIYGLGSMFSFELKQKVVAWDALGDYEVAYKASLGSRKKNREKFHAPTAHVLVVDDTPMNLVVFRSLLKRTAIKIDTANSGDEGISLSLETKYDMMFLDHMMPDKDGIQTLHEIRKQENNPNLKTTTICLTANAISGARERYLAEGFDDYLTKPIDSAKLEEMLLHYLPEDKIVRSDDTEYEEAASAGSDTNADNNAEDSAIPGFIRSISEIDVEKGLTNCGDADAYIETARLFAGMVKEYTDDIEKFWLSGDIKNATIKIHAIKSSSRIIGASGLGELAQELENAGSANDTEKLGARIDELLERYRALGNELAPLIQEDGQNESDLPMLGEDELRDIYTGIREFMSVSDFSSAADLIGNLKGYSFPDSEKERCKALIKAADEIEYEKITEIMQ